MSLNVTGIWDAVVSHADTLGIFERVIKHEPRNAPGLGLTCAIFAGPFGPVPAASGLSLASARVAFVARVYNPALQQPYDDIDPVSVDAAAQLMGAYAGAFTLGGLVRNVDVFGAAGPALGAAPGYINQDGKLFRTMDVTLPMIVNDVWSEVA